MVGVKPGAVGWGVEVVVGVDSGVAMGILAEKLTDDVGDGAAEAETQIWSVSDGFECLQRM